MTFLETALVFVGAPIAIFLVVAALVYGASSRRNARYRPGRSFTYMPVWFLAAERAASVASAEEHAAVEARHHSEGRPAVEARAASAVAANRKGGARGTW
jgi:hypothetical protein